MEKLIFSIAGISITIRLEEDLEFLKTPITATFGGFLRKAGKSKNILDVSYDYVNVWRGFGEIPVELHRLNFPERTEFLNAVKGVYRLSENSAVIGYLNGCLSYNFGSRAGHVFLFKARGSDMMVGSFLKLLFIFVSLIAAEENKFMLHGAGIGGQGKGYLFLGESGAGKTTIAGSAGKEDILSDDSPILATAAGRFHMYSSPFSQVNMFETKERSHSRKKIELHKLLFLKKGKELLVKKRVRRSAIAEIVTKHVHGFEFMDRNCKAAAFSFCSELCSRVPAYDLYFQKNSKYWDALASLEKSQNAEP